MTMLLYLILFDDFPLHIQPQFFNFHQLWLIYGMSISAVKHSDPVILTYMDTYIYTYTHSFSHTISIMFYPKRLDVVLCAVQYDLIAYPF